MLKDYLRFGIYACLFVTPFLANYVSNSMFFPFITGKNFGFRILVETALALYAILAIADASVRPKYTHLLGSFGAFIAVIFAADIFGVDPHRSLWSNYERMEGFVTHFHLFLYFFVMAAVMRTEKVWAWFGNTWLASSVFIFLSALGQVFGKERFYMGGGRVDAGLGNSEYVGIFGLFNAFLAALLFLRSPKGSISRYWLPAVGLVNVALVFMSQTRGSMLGLFGGVLLSLGLFAFFDKAHPMFRKIAIGSLGAFVVAGALFVNFRNTDFVKGIPALGRLAIISTQDSSTDARLTIWKMSWEGFKERPILGWGQENFIQVFAEKFDPKASRLEPWYDRSHDVFFDWLIAGGLLGLITYLSLYVVALYYVWIFKGGKNFSLGEKTIVTGMLAGYFVHNIFVFDCLVSYMFFFGVLAWISSRVISPEVKSERIKEESLDSGDLAIVSAVVFTVLAVVVYYVNVRNIAANQELILTMGNDAEHTGQLITVGGKQYLRIAPLVEPGQIGTNEAREQLIQQALSFARLSQEGKFPAAMGQEYLKLADENIQARMEEMPDDVRMISFAVTFYGNLGQMETAEKLFAHGIEVSPKRGALYLTMAQLRGSHGDFAKALEASAKAVEYMPGNGQAAGLHALILAYAGHASEIDKLYKDSDPFLHGQDRAMFAQAYQKAGETTKAQAVIAKAIDEEPSLAEQFKPSTKK